MYEIAPSVFSENSAEPSNSEVAVNLSIAIWCKIHEHMIPDVNYEYFIYYTILKTKIIGEI